MGSPACCAYSDRLAARHRKRAAGNSKATDSLVILPSASSRLDSRTIGRRTAHRGRGLAPRTAASGTIALALLACACVFAALAGPAMSLRLRTEALQQALSQLGPLGTAIAVSASWSRFNVPFDGQTMLTEDDLSAATTQIGGGLAESLTITAGSWGGLITALHGVTSGTARVPAGRRPASKGGRGRSRRT